MKGYNKDLPYWPIKDIEKSVDNLKIDDNGLHLLKVTIYYNIKSLIIYDPSKRITAKAALQHPYFKEIV